MFSSARLKPTLPKSQFPQKFESSFVNSEARQWKWELIECCLQKNWDQLIAKKKLGPVDCKKMGPVDCDKKLGPVDCDKKLGPVDCKKIGTSWLR